MSMSGVKGLNGLSIKGVAAATLIASLVLAAAGPLPAQAGASAPQQPGGSGRVDLSGASVDDIRTHILDACVIQQWGVSTSSKDRYAEPCACYARRITQALSEEELAAFRRSAVFNSSARPKAQAARAACNL